MERSSTRGFDQLVFFISIQEAGGRTVASQVFTRWHGKYFLSKRIIRKDDKVKNVKS